jgi:hypothetical protein
MELQFGSDKKVNSEIHTQYTKKQVIINQTCSFSLGY